MGNREYQLGFSRKGNAMFDQQGRQKKAVTMICVLSDFIDTPLSDLTLLNVGCSTGIIDEYLSRFFKNVVCIDIDDNAINFANNNFKKDNLSFEICDAMNLKFESSTFDVVVCSQVYEHVSDANILMEEIFRVLKPEGLVYFSAGNKLMYIEPHYNLPLLSVLPLSVANLYLKATGKGEFYYEQHLTYWGLKKLVSSFEIFDYTIKILKNPDKYRATYMIRKGSLKHNLSKLLAKYMIWLIPGYVWLLQKH